MPVDISGAIEVARAAFKAFADEDWDTVAGLIASPILKRTQTREVATFLAWAEFEATRAETGATGWVSYGTYSPQLLSEYGATRLDRVEGTPTIAELAALNPSAFFVRWLRWGIRGLLRRPVTAHVIGGVAERPDLAHVVYKGGPSFGPPPPVRSMPLVKLFAGWRLGDARDLHSWGGHSALLMRSVHPPDTSINP